MSTTTNRTSYPRTHETSVFERLSRSGDKVATLGQSVARYGLTLVLVWIGLMKFTAYEAQAIQPLVANSPLMSWVYSIFSVQAVSSLLGGVEIAVGLLIAARRFAPRAAAVGSGVAVLLFTGTLTFLVSTPGWEASLGGFPALSVTPGQFLIKDLVLLGVALWTLGDALRAVARRRA